MRRLIVSTNPWPLWIAAERTIALKGKGSIVDGMNAFGLINAQAAYPGWSWRDRLAERIDRKYERFVRPALSGSDITSSMRLCAAVPPLFEQVEELRGYVHPTSGSRLGLAALSTAISITRIGIAELTAEYGDALIRAWRVAHLANDLAMQISASEYDEIFIFNGRHCYARPFCDVLERETKIVRYEGGALSNSFITWAGSLHEPDSFAAMLRTLKIDNDAANEFFLERIDRKPGTDSYKFTGRQIRNQLPEVVREYDGDVVAFFNTSTDEYLAVTENVRFGPFESQGEVALELAKICKVLDKKLVLRLHPNLLNADRSWQNEWMFEELRSLDVCIIGPDELVDSYALLRRASLVVTCGSTIGVEAAFEGIPSITVGRYFSTAVGATLEASSGDDMRRFIESPVFCSKQRQAAIAYASYFKTSGQKIEGFHTSADGFCATIDNRDISVTRSLWSLLNGKSRGESGLHAV